MAPDGSRRLPWAPALVDGSYTFSVTAKAALLEWFDHNRRDLPWRRDRDPYRVWISEVMLQQTRVDVVIPYYERFLVRFPNVQALAAAETDEVLALWSGLGYYRRARQLHAAAREIANRGLFPSSLEGLRSLPGIGAYTAAAIASIAFDVPEPVLDGNVERVISRLLAEAGDVKTSAVRKRLHVAAAELVDLERPGDSNQALMELGATVCLPRRPRCLFCPLVEGCAASGDQPERFPSPRKERAREERLGLAVRTEDGGRILLFRRPDDSTLLAGLWELPWLEVVDGAPEEALAERYGGRWILGERLGSVRHGITFRDLTIEVRSAEILDSEQLAERSIEARWFRREEMESLALPSLVSKLLAVEPERANAPKRRLRSGPNRQRG